MNTTKCDKFEIQFFKNRGLCIKFDYVDKEWSSLLKKSGPVTLIETRKQLGVY